jgi:hypothetical protein
MDELSLYSIAYLFSLDDSRRKLYQIDINFQILGIEQNLTTGGLKLTLSDSLNFYNEFSVSKLQVKFKFELFDIINVKVVSPLINTIGKKLFLLKDISLVQKCSQMIENPVEYSYKLTYANGNKRFSETRNNISNMTLTKEDEIIIRQNIFNSNEKENIVRRLSMSKFKTPDKENLNTTLDLNLSIKKENLFNEEIAIIKNYPEAKNNFLSNNIRTNIISPIKSNNFVKFDLKNDKNLNLNLNFQTKSPNDIPPNQIPFTQNTTNIIIDQPDKRESPFHLFNKKRRIQSYSADAAKQKSFLETIKLRKKNNKIYIPISLLSDLINTFNLLIRVIEIYNYNNSITLYVKDNDENYAKIVIPPRLMNKYNNTFKNNGIYSISNGTVQDCIGSKIKYRNFPIKYTILINESSTIIEQEDDKSIKIEENDIQSIADIQEFYNKGKLNANFLLYILNVEESISREDIKYISTDFSNYAIEFIPLHRANKNNVFKIGDVIMIKNALIAYSYEERKFLLSTYTSSIDVNPQINLSRDLKNYVENNHNKQITPHKEKFYDHSPVLASTYIKHLLKEMDSNLVPYYPFPHKIIRARIINFTNNKNNTYPACPQCRKCLKKDNSNPYRCESCKRFYTNAVYNYSLMLNVADCSTIHQIKIFGELGDRLININADQYTNIIFNSNDPGNNYKLNKIKESLDYREFYFIIQPRIKLIKYNIMEKEFILANFEPVPDTTRRDYMLNIIKKFKNNLK